MNGKKVGEYKKYYEHCDGEKIEEIFTYADNTKNGIYKRYYTNIDSFGQLEVTYSYVNNMINGEFKSYYENGQLKQICSHISHIGNKTHGEYKKYNKNGDLIKFSNYNDGSIIVNYKQYYNKGAEVFTICTSIDDEIDKRINTQNKKVIIKENYRNGELGGIRTYYSISLPLLPVA